MLKYITFQGQYTIDRLKIHGEYTNTNSNNECILEEAFRFHLHSDSLIYFWVMDVEKLQNIDLRELAEYYGEYMIELSLECENVLKFTVDRFYNVKALDSLVRTVMDKKGRHDIDGVVDICVKDLGIDDNFIQFCRNEISESGEYIGLCSKILPGNIIGIKKIEI